MLAINFTCSVLCIAAFIIEDIEFGTVLSMILAGLIVVSLSLWIGSIIAIIWIFGVVIKKEVTGLFKEEELPVSDHPSDVNLVANP